MPPLRFLLWKEDFPPHKSSCPTRTHCWICLKIRKGSTLSRSSKVFRQSEPHNAAIQCGNAPCSLTISPRRLRPNPALHPLVRDRRRSGFHTCFAYFHLIFGCFTKSRGKQCAAESRKKHRSKDRTAKRAFFPSLSVHSWQVHAICCRYGLALPKDSVKIFIFAPVAALNNRQMPWRFSPLSTFSISP